MANLGYQIIEYDASIDKAPYNHPNITFYKKFVGISEGEDTTSFENIIKTNHLNNRAHNILQVDIEDCEWDILDSVDLELISKYFCQIIFEFHNCNPNDEALSQKRFRILEKLKRYYTPIHAHFNNFSNLFYSNGLFWCDVVEVSYIKNELIQMVLNVEPTATANDKIDKIADFENMDCFSQKLKVGLGNIIGLDFPNAKGYPDIPIIFPES